MKKFYLLLVLAILVNSLTGCNFNPPNRGNPIIDIKFTVYDRMQKLKSLGIKDETGLVESRIIEWYDEMSQYEELSQYIDVRQVDKMILSDIGLGTYDFDTFVWSPTSGAVYSFDTEVFDIEKMYTLFLEGVSSIAGPDADFTEIEEDLTQVDLENGTGKQIIRFTSGGTRYQFEAEAYYDWFDMNAIAFMNDVFKKEGRSKKLWAATDDYQSCILFYNTKQWADEFKSVMGWELY